MVQVKSFGTGTRYRLEILHKCGKRVETKSQKMFGANFYVSRSYRGKTGREGFFILLGFRVIFRVIFLKVCKNKFVLKVGGKGISLVGGGGRGVWNKTVMSGKNFGN